MKVIIGIDIGGTTIKIGKFNNDLLIEKYFIDTDVSNNGENIISDICEFLKKITINDEIIGIGIGVPGPVINSKVYFAHNIAWKVKNIKEEVNEYFPNITIVALNDANGATLGEMAYGGGIGYDSLVFVTLGTGIGAGIVINKKLIEGVTGSAGEIGHIKVEVGNKRKCTCGLYDCVEQYSSATGIIQNAKELIELNYKTILNSDNLSAKNIFEAAMNNDVVGITAVDKMVDKLAIALASVATTINPDIFIIGGGISKAGDFLIKKLEKRFKELAFPSVINTKFGLAKLGNDAGIYGCMYQVKINL